METDFVEFRERLAAIFSTVQAIRSDVLEIKEAQGGQEGRLRHVEIGQRGMEERLEALDRQIRMKGAITTAIAAAAGAFASFLNR